MNTLLVFITFIGFFLTYNTSKKAKLNRSFFLEKKAQDYPREAKIIGLGLMILVLIGSVFHWGVASGIFAFFVILMTVGSMVVLIPPLRYLGYRLVGVLFVVSFIIELIFS